MNRTFTAVAALVLTAAPASSAPPTVVPLQQAHAHNDYEHPRPLLDALDHGFCSVEADIFLTPDGLLVGHTRKDLRPGRTLESLYLDPLRERVRANGGRVYRGGPPIFLLIDVKTEAKETCAALLVVLARYADILSVTRDGKFEPRAVTVVVSGNSDRETLTRPVIRYAGIDGLPSDADSKAPVDLIPWISADWEDLYRWRGAGPMPETEREKLRAYVRAAHARGRLVRFWATPEKQAVWEELSAAGVDLIGTDDLDGLRSFLLARISPKPAETGPCWSATVGPCWTTGSSCGRFLRSRSHGRRLLFR
jgi:hypothetical protein